MDNPDPGSPRVFLYVLLWLGLFVALVNALLRGDTWAVFLALGWAVEAVLHLTASERAQAWQLEASRRQQTIDNLWKQRSL